MVDTQIRAGRLLAVRHGVYVSADAWPDDPRARHVALGHAEQAANPGAVLSHESAAVAWGLPSPTARDWHEQGVCVTLPPGQGHGSQRGPVRHRVRVLGPDDVVRDPEGYEVTSIARTATDLAVGRTLPEALVILDGAARGLVDRFVSRPRRSDYANPRLMAAARDMLLAACDRPGTARPISCADPRRESAAESLSAGHFLLAAVPTPDYQTRLVTTAGTFYPDFFWSDQRVIGEVDGAVKYEAADAFVAEKQREQVMRDLGFTIVRWLAREIMLTPEVVVARVSRALAL